MSQKVCYEKLINNYIKQTGLVRQHIESYNYFITKDIFNIMKANAIVDSDVDSTFFLKYTNIYVQKPQIHTLFGNATTKIITPHECRLRDESYLGNILVDIEYTRNKELVVKKGVSIGKIPIMLRSIKCNLYTDSLIMSQNEREGYYTEKNECPIDNGGYFIIKGVERVILIQEQLSKNRIILEKTKDSLVASVTSSTAMKKSKTNVYLDKNGELFVQNNVFEEDIPLCILIKAFGTHSNKRISQYIGEDLNQLLEPSLELCCKNNIHDSSSALEYIGNKIRIKHSKDRTQEARSIITDVILPNVEGNGIDFRSKSLYLCIMARRLLMAHSKTNKNFDTIDSNLCSGRDSMSYFDDKDFTGNKRYELSGQLLSILFEDLFKRYNTELKKSIDKVLIKRASAQSFDVVTFMNLQLNIITMAFTRSISTGNWSVKRFRMERAGITQVLCRFSNISALGTMSRINSQFEKTRKVSGPRSLHTSQWGYICPSDTPEGELCGLVKNLALMSEITTDTPPEDIIDVIFQIGCIDINIFDLNLYVNNRFLIFLDGMIIGYVDHSDEFVRKFRNLRRKGKLHRFVSINKNETQKSIYISADGGRITRPLIIINKKNSPKLTQKSKTVEHLKDDYNQNSESNEIYCNRKSNTESLDNKKRQDIMKHILVEDEKTPFEFQVAVTEDDIYFVECGYKDFEHLICEGKIEYIDANEACDILASFQSNGTHLEIASFAILGTVAGLIPFPDHNQSPRNTYQCAMSKQAMGYIAYNMYKRHDTLMYVLTHSQRPLVKTKTIDLINFEKLPAGANAMVAVMSYSGYDIEDALVMNRSSIDRGFGRCEIYKNNTNILKKYSDGTHDSLYGRKKNPSEFEARNEIQDNKELLNEKSKKMNDIEIKDNDKKISKKKANEEDSIIKSKKSISCTVDTTKSESKKPQTFNDYRYGAIDIDGLSAPGTILSDLQVFVNIETPQCKFAGSIFRSKTETATVSSVIITKNFEDQLTVKSLLRQVRRPEIGDKFSSRHGQKGVVGLIVDEENLPFNEYGICPDIIMNPHGFPSRMTVGKILELICGKAALLKGDFIYATPFMEGKRNNTEVYEFFNSKFEDNSQNNHHVSNTVEDGKDYFLNDIKETLIQNGFSCHGKDVFYSGITGKILNCYVFYGPVYYQKLKHMVSDKIHGRGKGPRAMLTRQPTEGRSKDGGLRLGEMERDCLIGYGASNLLVERLLISSDDFFVWICKVCGVICYKDRCNMCDGSKTIRVRIPYACKLLFQELMSMNILPRLIIE